MPFQDGYFLACMASFIVLKKDDRFFLMRRQNTKWCNGLYNIPAGQVERHETIIECAIRELKEEAGVAVKAADLKLFLIANRYTGVEGDKQPDWIDFYYVAEKWEGEPHIAEPHKCDHAGWFKLDDPSIEIIPSIRDALNYASTIKMSYALQSPEHNFSNQKDAS